MSQEAVRYINDSLFGSNEKLAAYYDFASGQDFAFTGVGPYTGVYYNQQPAFDTGIHPAVVLAATGASQAAAETLFDSVVGSSYLDLNASNLKIAREALNFNDLSVVMDVEFHDVISDGVLFGAYQKFVQGGIDPPQSGSYGYNFGIDDRGNMFFQGLRSLGPFVAATSELELSKRNIISFSVAGDEVEICRYDYINDVIQSETFPVEPNYMANDSEFYIGGSKDYAGITDPTQVTFNGKIHAIAILSGGLGASSLKMVGSGMMGEYLFESESSQEIEQVTGYQETTVYKTGVTGIELQQNVVLIVETGRLVLSGEVISSADGFASEGDRYEQTFSFNNGESVTITKEELGLLVGANAYQYEPTGSGVHATLGLQNDLDIVSNNFVLGTGYNIPTGSYNLYQQVEFTGVLEEISGVTQTPLTKTVTITQPSSSGVRLTGYAEPFLKDYIYFTGPR